MLSRESLELGTGFGVRYGGWLGRGEARKPVSFSQVNGEYIEAGALFEKPSCGLSSNSRRQQIRKLTKTKQKSAMRWHQLQEEAKPR